jgi:serine/threonine protein kinase
MNAITNNFDELDEYEMEMSYSYDDFLTRDARCISIESSSPESSPASSPLIPPTSSPVSIESTRRSYIAVTDGRQCDITDVYNISATILGTGNYGCVRECQHRTTGARCAVKTIIKSKVSQYDHILREIQLLRAVGDHRFVMRMIDCFEDAEYVHIVTERYTGGELFDRIVDNTHDRGCLAEDEAARIIKSLLEAVAYLHGKNIVHRDIKPENILFETNDRCSPVKLIDFGLSRRHDPNDSLMTNRVGTPYYMSPAVLRGKYDRSCDLWSVGIVAYILLSGYPPFNGSTDVEVHDSVRIGDLVFADVIWGSLSRESRDFIRKLLSMDSSSIFCSAEEALRHPWMSCR